MRNNEYIMFIDGDDYIKLDAISGDTASFSVRSAAVAAEPVKTTSYSLWWILLAVVLVVAKILKKLKKNIEKHV